MPSKPDANLALVSRLVLVALFFAVLEVLYSVGAAQGKLGRTQFSVVFLLLVCWFVFDALAIAGLVRAVMRRAGALVYLLYLVLFLITGSATVIAWRSVSGLLQVI